MTAAQLAYETYTRIVETPEPKAWEDLTQTQREAWQGAVSEVRRKDRLDFDGDDGARALKAAREALGQERASHGNTRRQLVQSRAQVDTLRVEKRTLENKIRNDASRRRKRDNPRETQAE